MGKSVVILSGGLDSTVALAKAVQESSYADVHALSFDYGQRHKKELEHAKAITDHYTVEHHIVDLTSITPLISNSSQTSEDIAVPHGHYAEENMKATVVPNRNMIMLSIAIGWAVNIDAAQVVFGVHAGDHDIYPDCRPEFVDKMDEIAAIANWHPVEVYAPFRNMTKADIVAEGDELVVPWALTWSCYEGGEIHCGKCATCIERREAFYHALVDDPTIYQVSLMESFAIGKIHFVERDLLRYTFDGENIPDEMKKLQSNATARFAVMKHDRSKEAEA